VPSEAAAVQSEPSLNEIGLPAIRTAAAAIAPYVVRTPTLPLVRLSADLGLPVVGKFELLQHTGSFKVRGAFSRLQRLTETERAAGVVAVSGGNHGLAVAYAARVLGIQASVIMPVTAAPASVAQVRADGAQLIVLGTIGEAFARALAEVETGKVLIHPFDDPAVVTGQGTLALELYEDAPEVTDVIASVGGGGMITGVAAALKALNPAIRIWGVETEGADVMTRSLRAGHPVTLDAVTSIATTLGAPTVAPLTLAGVRELVEEIVVVPDAAAVRGIELLAATAKVITEPATGCLWAAALELRDRLPTGAQLALVLCGGNAGLDDIAAWRSRFPAGPIAVTT
jgi:threonine dehydratase